MDEQLLISSMIGMVLGVGCIALILQCWWYQIRHEKMRDAVHFAAKTRSAMRSYIMDNVKWQEYRTWAHLADLVPWTDPRDINPNHVADPTLEARITAALDEARTIEKRKSFRKTVDEAEVIILPPPLPVEKAN